MPNNSLVDCWARVRIFPFICLDSPKIGSSFHFYADLLSDVFLYAEWVKEQGVDARDTGIDLVAETIDHEQ